MFAPIIFNPEQHHKKKRTRAKIGMTTLATREAHNDVLAEAQKANAHECRLQHSLPSYRSDEKHSVCSQCR